MSHVTETGPAAESTAAARYQALEAGRRPFLDRAREAARLTTPALLPPEGHGAAAALPTPYQGVGARGVNTLANKLLLAQFPPSAPFFRLVVDPLALDRLHLDGRAPGDEEAAALGQAMADVERAVLGDFETGFLRAALHGALKQLIVAGNCLLHLNPDGGARVFRLDRYVVKRDPMGGVREIIVKETLTPDQLPDGFDALDRRRGARRFRGADGPSRFIDLFTWIRRETDHWSVRQEALGQEIPGSAGRYALGRLDWMALRWAQVDGEDYGRGHVEEVLGDLRSLEGLMQAIVEGAAAAARMTVLVAPNGQTDAEELAEAENGAIIDGVASDVSILQAGKAGDFKTAFEVVRMLTDRLSFAFLLGAEARREATRVTAEEIRFVAAELENALGGVYSVLAEELQKPLVSLLMHHKTRQGLLPPLPEGLARPEIVTGLDALGRGRDLERLEAFIGFIGKIGSLSQTPMAAQLDLPAMLLKGAAALGVAADDLIRPAAAEPGFAPGEGAPAALAAAGEAFRDPAVLTVLAERVGPALQALAGSDEGAAALGGLADALGRNAEGAGGPRPIAAPVNSLTTLAPV